MPPTQVQSGWNILPPVTIPAADRLDHVRNCSDFAAGLLDRDPAVRVVVLAATGRSFCAGGDLGWMQAQIDAKWSGYY